MVMERNMAMERNMIMKVGIIGFGRRIGNVWDDIKKFDMGVELTAITDIRNDDIKKQLEEKGIDTKSIAFYKDADEMMDKEELNGVMIGTRCNLHARMAIKVLSRNIPLFLEKPVATNMEDLLALRKAWGKTKSEVVVSFPLKLSEMVKTVKEILDSGMIGTVEHVQALHNDSGAGDFYNAWYRDDGITGGLFLQKATHDFDYLNYLIGLKPVQICAMTSKQIFKGDKPAGLLCRNCNDQETCLESTFYVSHFKHAKPTGEMCSFAVDTGNEDSGSALIRYETGMHAVYSQNFFVRNGVGSREARFMGYKGTVSMDFYSDEVKVFMHHTPRVGNYVFDSKTMGHSGGDDALAYNFIKVMQGREKSRSPLGEGLDSVLLCLKAKESAESNEFKDIKWPEE